MYLFNFYQETNTANSELLSDDQHAGIDEVKSFALYYVHWVSQYTWEEHLPSRLLCFTQATESVTDDDVPSPFANRENEDPSSQEAEFLTGMKRLFGVVKGTDVLWRHCSKITRK